ncbi:unnamed protein product, partial [Discosporangium mesarthrocarpum]
LSLHEKCAYSLSLQQKQPDEGEPHASWDDMEQLSLPSVSGVLSGDKCSLRAIMSLMGPSDLSLLEDEVKIIQQNVRAWRLRCNYKSLRKAARTLQVVKKYRMGKPAGGSREEEAAKSLQAATRVMLARQ